MNKQQFRARLVLCGHNQASFARLISKSANCITTMLKRDKVPKLYQLAIIGLEQSKGS